MQRYAISGLAIIGLLSGGCKETASEVVSNVVKASKDTAAGIAEGVKEGRKSGESADGALVVSDGEQLQKQLTLTVLSSGAAVDNPESTTVTIALANAGDRPVRVTGLNMPGVSLVLDTDDFNAPATAAASEITVPPKAKSKLTYTANIKPEAAKLLRVWGKDFPLK